MNPDLLPQLQSALGDDYRFEQELGGGGMSRVFIALELGLGRRVAEARASLARLGAEPRP